jgi:dephospho-CoA kinase
VIKQLAAEAFQRANHSGTSFIVYECPLLFEAKLENEGFRKIILVTAKPELCLSRIMERDKLSESEAKKRIAAQFPVEEKRLKSDIIIDNSGSHEELKAKVVQLYSELTAK